MRLIVVLVLLVSGGTVQAQIYKWIGPDGKVTYTNGTPPPGARAVVVDPNATEAAPAPQSAECYTIRCQGERMEARQRLQAETDARVAAANAAAAAANPQKPARGLDFRKYISLRRGMTEGELLVIAGEPDLRSNQGAVYSAPMTVQGSRNLAIAGRAGLNMTTYTYLPTPADPYVTTVTLVGGRISELERISRF